MPDRLPTSLAHAPQPFRNPRSRPPFALSRLVVLTGSLCAAGAAGADSWRVSPEISAGVTSTSNTSYNESQAGSSDIVLDVAPTIKVRGAGGGFSLDGQMTLNGLAYTRGTRSNEVLPDGQFKFNSSLLDRWLYLDANARVVQTAANPLLGRSDGSTGANQLTTATFDIAPYLSHDFTPTLNATARTQWAWSKREDLRDIDAQTHQVRVEQRTIPLGWALDWSEQSTHFEGDADPALQVAALRATGVYSPDTRWKAGVIIGRERNEFNDSSNTDNLYGLLLDFAPTERTTIGATVERRFFGTGWNARLRHRAPFMSLTAQLIRRPTAQANTQDVANNTTTAQLLDAMLTTRYPDPEERAAIVDQTLNQLALPTRLGGAAEINAETPQLEQSARLSAAFQGRLTTFTFTVYTTDLSPLTRSDGDSGTPAAVQLATRQRGFLVDLNRRLDAVTTADIVYDDSRVRRIGAGPDESAHDRTLRLSLARQLDPNTTASVAIRRRLRDAVVVGAPLSVSETGFVVGVSYRF